MVDLLDNAATKSDSGSDSSGNNVGAVTGAANAKKTGLDRKWVVLFGAFVARIITTGTVVYLGVFLDDVQHSLTGSTSAQMGLVPACAIGLLEGMGVACTLLIKKFEGSHLVFIGGLLAFAGVLVSSFTTHYIVLLVGLGIINGFGQGMGRYIMPLAVGYMFDDKTRHIGMSIANAGDGLGGIVSPILLTYLIDKLTWRTAMLIMAGLVLNLCMSAVTIPKGLLFRNANGKEEEDRDDAAKEKLALDERIGNGHNNKDVENNSSVAKATDSSSSVRAPLFPNLIFFYTNIICHSVGYFVFMTFIHSEMKETRIEPHVVSRVVSLIGGVSIIGRLSVSLMKGNDWVPRWLTYSVCHVIRGLSVLATIWAPQDLNSKIMCYSIICSVYGLSDGITGALIPVVCVDLFGIERFAAVFAWEMLVMGTGALLGPPVAGAMKDWFNSYQISFTFSGCSFIVAGLILLPLFFTQKHYQLAKLAENRDAANASSEIPSWTKNGQQQKNGSYEGTGGVSLVEIKPRNFE